MNEEWGGLSHRDGNLNKGEPSLVTSHMHSVYGEKNAASSATAGIFCIMSMYLSLLSLGLFSSAFCFLLRLWLSLCSGLACCPSSFYLWDPFGDL
ncbi:hypothetical protein V6N11_058630 [Hibiscus sabdariffa]|uniref:Uncharacterized protein n=1 Tax=Hibiscus sabdariffa TaxID=183260 RepID=A0ABR2U5I8_9ROSI